MVAKKTNSGTGATISTGFLEIPPYKEKKGEEYMNSNQLQHFAKILAAWKEQLMHEVDTTVDHMKQDATVYADPVDRASQEEGFNLELRTRDRERKLLRKIEEALDRIDHGEYGYCTDCGTEIGIRRLEARPTAVKCIDCKTFEEIRERQTSV
jgi:DnaK suppressor protein